MRVGLHCGGPTGCRLDGRMIWCDQSLASENDLCLAPHTTQFGDGACTPDRKAMLACTNGRFQPVSSCHGPQGCKHDAGKIACDNSAAEPGDLCRTEGNLACSLDGARVLTCKAGKFRAAARAAAAPSGAAPARPRSRCDQSIASEGDPCRSGGAGAAPITWRCSAAREASAIASRRAAGPTAARSSAGRSTATRASPPSTTRARAPAPRAAPTGARCSRAPTCPIQGRARLSSPLRGQGLGERRLLSMSRTPRQQAAIAAGAAALATVVFYVGATYLNRPRVMVVGESCGEVGGSCRDRASELACVGGVRILRNCRGPSGCRESGPLLTCDQSVANEGDPCDRQTAQLGCTADGTAMLTCDRGEMRASAACLGELGCHIQSPTSVACDQSRARPDSACSEAGAYMLAPSTAPSSSGATAAARRSSIDVCRGPAGCDKLRCDRLLPTVGDPCPGPGTDCTADKQWRLLCENGAWKRDEPCRGASGCAVSADGVTCDVSLGVVDDPCEGTGAACSTDGRSLLQCANGKLKVDRACPHRCDIEPSGTMLSCK